MQTFKSGIPSGNFASFPEFVALMMFLTLAQYAAIVDPAPILNVDALKYFKDLQVN